MSGPDIHLLSVGTALPGPPVDNATLISRLGVPSVWEEWVDSFIGTRSRHFSIDLDTGEARHSLTDLGESAGARALASAGLGAADIDLVVLGTSSPDQLMPATVNMVAERLGIDDVPTYQLQSGCCGAVQALDVARTLLRARGRGHALVLGGDNSVKHFDTAADFSALPSAEQVNVLLFGDGAGAMVLGTEPAPGSAVIRHVLLRLVGLNRPPGQVVEWFGRGDRGSDRSPVVEDYKAIEESVPALAVEVLDAMLDELDWKETDVDYLLPPQLSGRMTARITEGLGVPAAEEVSCVVDIGNTGNALPFFQLERALPRMIGGDRAVGIAIESSKWIKAGFALEKV
ncbi:3-oxoacyl-ACP synthase III family protein [Spirillospora sp. NBC_00431]